MKKTAQYYWNKVKVLYFDNQDFSLNQMLDIAEECLSQDEFLHLKELIKEVEE